jgi:integrase
MGSITKKTRVDKRTGKAVTVFRAYVRREGYASKSKVCSTDREAKEWLRENDATSSLSRRVSGKTLGDVLDAFVEAPPMRGTRYWSAQHLDFWRAELGPMRIADISRGDINAGKAKLQRKFAMRSTPTGPKPTDKLLTPATVNRYLASLSSVLNYAMEHEIIDAHPMKGGKVKMLTEAGGRTRILTADEEVRLMDAARASSWLMLALFVRMCLTTAARKSEILNLRWKQLRLEDSIAVLSTTKNGRPRALPLVADVRAALEDAAKVKPVRGDYVFFDPHNPERPKNINSAWRICRESAGLLNDRDDPLDRVYLHSTRHTAVTRMLKGGANLAQAAAVSGHQTLAMLKRYEHLAASDAVDIAEKHLAGKADDGAAR